METAALEIHTSRQFTKWLHEQQISLAFSTYQAGKLFLIGTKSNGRLSIFERSFERCMGLHATGSSLYLGTQYQIWKLENSLKSGQTYQDYDAVYIPQASTVTGDVDAHDLQTDKNGTLYFVNTLFSCLAEASASHSFKPIWRPPFISKLAAEDRCHLNGLAMKQGKPAYVTALATTDIHEGWRDHREAGGVVMDINRNDVIADGLSMPHSPRWHNGHLWLHQSGTGEFGYVDVKSGKFTPVCFCPGYLRGLSFHGDFAIAGLSRPRGNPTFSGLALDKKLATQQVNPRCGLCIIDLKTGDLVHSLNIEGIVDEIYDVVVLPDCRTPMALGFKTDEIQWMVSIDE